MNRSALVRSPAAACATVLLPIFAACTPDAVPERVAGGVVWPEGVTPEVVEEGREIFGTSGFCYTCHGYDASGGMGADLADDEWWHSDGSYEGIIGTILAGVSGDQSRGGPASTMEPKGGTQMSDEQIRAVAAFVWSLSRVEPADGEGG